MTDETRIARPENRAIGQYGAWGIEGLDGITGDDLIVPRLEILQPTSRKEGQPGHFHLNIDGSTFETVEAVVLRISRTRVLWSGDTSARAPECSSLDGITGRTHGACKGCEFNRFDTSGSLKVCKGGYTFLCANPENAESLFLLSAYGTSATPARVLLSQFVTKRRSPFTAIVRFATKAEKGDKGKYFVLVATIQRLLTASEYMPFQDISRAMQGIAIQEVEPDEGATLASEIAAAQDDVATQNASQRQSPVAETPTPPVAPQAKTEPDSEDDLWDQLGATKQPPASDKAQPRKAPATRKPPF